MITCQPICHPDRIYALCKIRSLPRPEEVLVPAWSALGELVSLTYLVNTTTTSSMIYCNLSHPCHHVPPLKRELSHMLPYMSFQSSLAVEGILLADRLSFTKTAFTVPNG